MDQLFFWLSKVIWILISPDLVLVILTCLGLALLFFGRKGLGKILLTLVCAAMVTLTLVPLGEYLTAPLENRFETNPSLPDKVDGIILLGGSEKGYLSHLRGQPELNDSAERYLGFVRLMQQYPEAALIFTGGSGKLTKRQYTDADVARQVFSNLGIDTARIRFEGGSKNTYENAILSKAAMAPEPGQVWILVTTAMHLPRAVGVFEQAGWPVIPYPVDHVSHPEKEDFLRLDFSGNLKVFKMAVREWVGLVAYFATGRTPALLPGKP